MPQGQLTFDAEGGETEGRYFSHKPHVPGANSGVTIGPRLRYERAIRQRNYRGPDEFWRVDGERKKFSRCRGLKGKEAK